MRKRPCRKFRFTLRTFFVTLTIAAVPLSFLTWHLRWIQQRREARQWLGARDLKASIVNRQGVPRELPWGLRMLGESPLHECVVGANNDDRADLAAFHQHVAAIQMLFPECYLINAENGD